MIPLYIGIPLAVLCGSVTILVAVIAYAIWADGPR